MHHKLIRRFVVLGLVGIVIGGTGGDSAAVSPSTWRTAGVDGWRTTGRDSIGVSSDGTIGVAWSTERIQELDAFVVWDLLADGNDVLAATGDGGVLYRVTAEGTVEEAARVVQPEITALGRDGRGRVVLGASPDGVLYRWGGALEPAADTPETYIWDILPDRSGGVLVATGNEGKVYRLDGRGKLTVLSDLHASHVTGLARFGDTFLATTSRPGRLVRLTGQGETQVLFDGGDEELRSPVAAGDGMIYFLANPEAGGGKVHRLSPNGAIEVVWRASEGFLYHLQAQGNDRLWVTTGSEAGSATVVRLSVTPPREWIELMTVTEPQVLTMLVEDRGPAWIGTGGRGSVYRVGGDNALGGTATSEVQDAGGTARWGALTVEGGGAERGVRVDTRSGNTRLPDETWSSWDGVSLDGGRGAVDSPAARFLQWRVEIDDREARVGGIRVVYLPANRAPQVTKIEVSELGASLKESGTRGAPASLYQNLPGGVRAEFQPQTGRPQETTATDTHAAWARRYRGVTWEAQDPNQDRLEYALELRRMGEAEWMPLAEELSSSPWIWDSSTVPDGWYAIRVRASDSPDNPPGEEESDYRHTEPFLVDNTAPQVTGLRVSGNTLTGVAEDSQSPIKMMEMAVDGQEWRRVFPEDGIPDTPRETFSTPLRDLKPGEHVVLIRVFDLAGNPGTGRVAFRVR